MIGRRQPLSLPYPDQVTLLASLLRGDGEEPVRPEDPGRFAEAALHHHLAGYAAAAISSGGVLLPAGERDRLGREGAIRLLRSRLLRAELEAIAAPLAEACGDEPLVVKGPAVADRLYPDARLRPFVDIDLLVPRERLAAGARALEERGYSRLVEFAPGFETGHGHDIHLSRPAAAGLGLDVELHWRIGDDPATAGLDHALLSDGAEPLGEWAPARRPAPAAELLALAVHLLSDRTKRLIWVQDLALGARGASEEEWERCFDLARRTELLWVLHRALDYARHHLGFDRERPLPAGSPPPWGPLRAVEELSVPASLHLGRLATLGWRRRLSYLRTVLVPTRAGLRGTVGHDAASTPRLIARHIRAAMRGLLPRR